MTNTTSTKAASISDVLRAISNTASPVAVQRLQITTDHSGEEIANVLFHVADSRIKTEAQLDAAITRAFTGKIALMPFSAHRPAVGTDPSLVLATVCLQREMRTYTEGGMSGLTMVSANVFRDADDCIWNKAGEGATAVLVRDTDDDLEAILGARQSRSIVTASMNVSLHETARPGEAIMFYDTARRQTRPAVAMDSGVAYTLDTNELQIINPDLVFASAVHSRAVEVASIAGSAIKGLAEGEPTTAQNRLSRYMAYSAMLFARNGEYYKRLRSLLASSYGEAALRAQ